MFVTADQAFVFIVCVAYGGTFGVLFTVSAAVKGACVNKWVGVTADIAAFTVFAVGFAAFGFYMGFPSYRLYMSVGAMAGITLYMKSLHITLAKFSEKLYNITVIKIRAATLKKRERKKVGRTDKQDLDGRRRGKRRDVDGRRGKRGKRGREQE